MDIKTEVLTKVITQVMNNMIHHPNWDSMIDATDWMKFDCEIDHEVITSKIQKRNIQILFIMEINSLMKQ